MTEWLHHASLLWLIAAALLAGLELAIPGIFLIYMAAAAAITGAVAFLFPGFPVSLQWALFAALSAVLVMLLRRWYRKDPVETSDPLLNDRTARLIGQHVTVTDAIRNGRGRVRVGDGEWPARGPDSDAGSLVRIVGSEAAVLDVETIDTPIS